MTWLRISVLYFYTRVRGLFRKRRVEDDMDAEMRFHIHMMTQENVHRGMDADQARLQASKQFGNFYHLKDIAREIRGGGIVETIWHDVRFGLRQLVKSPGFALIAILSLALGIGANTAIFSLVSTVLLRPLPVANPNDLVSIFPVSKTNPDGLGIFSYPTYKDYRDRNEVLSGMAVYRFAPISLSNKGSNERVWGYMVSGNYFDVLGVNAFKGRTFAPEEDRTEGSSPVVITSYACWKTRFGADPAIIGKTVTLNGHNFTVIGVAPQGFIGTELIFTPEFWVPSMMQPWIEPEALALTNRDVGQWFSIGRLKPGINQARAEAALSSISDQLGREYPKTDEGTIIRLSTPGLVIPSIRGYTITVTAVLMLIVGLVLLIACTNLANLLLARASRRRKEIALRIALGAGRLRLIRQLLTESIMLSVIGGAGGLMTGIWLMSLAKKLTPPIDFNLTIDLHMDWRVFGFVILLSVFTGIAFGLIPALQATKTDLVTALKDGLAGSGYRRSILLNVLVATQVMFSFVLLIVAGLVVRSLQHVQSIGPGFETDRALTMSVDLVRQGYNQPDGEAFYRKMLEKVKSISGVQNVALAAGLPLSLDYSSTGIIMEGEPEVNGGNIRQAVYDSVGPGYFATMGIPLMAGRDFTEDDKADSTKVVIVNETFARKFCHGQAAVGKRFHPGGGADGGPLFEIVGVAKDGKYFSLGEDPTPYVYYPLSQNYSPSCSLVVRTYGDPRAEIGAIRSEVQQLNPDLPVFNVKTLAEHMGLSLFPLRVGAGIAGAFGFLALILAAMGIYGVMSYSISQRTREVGIRMALGANKGEVLRLMVKPGVIITAMGMGVGLIIAVFASMLISGVLYGVSSTDSTTFVGVAVLLSAVAIIACVIPALRATRVDPMAALRCD